MGSPSPSLDGCPRRGQSQVSPRTHPGAAARPGQREEGAGGPPTSLPDRIPSPAITHHLLQLLGRLLHSLSVIAVHHEDETLREKPGWGGQLAPRRGGRPRWAAGTPSQGGERPHCPPRPPLAEPEHPGDGAAPSAAPPPDPSASLPSDGLMGQTPTRHPSAPSATTPGTGMHSLPPLTHPAQAGSGHKPRGSPGLAPLRLMKFIPALTPRTCVFWK